MLNDDLHIPDGELLMVADGEVSGRRSAEVRTHLAACWRCRARMAEIEATIVDFARARGESPGEELPSAAGPRALLSAQLAELAAKRGEMPGGWFRSLRGAMRPVVVGLALLSVALIGRLAMHSGGLLDRGADRGADLSSPQRGVVPDGRLTPGATRTVTVDELCSSAHEEVVGQVTAPLRNEVLREYGIVSERAGDYEIDYLIAPGLGGTEDIRNLWPQPYNARTWNAYAKDALEERLHQMVCGRKLDVAEAQREIARDWIAAYKKYFQTDRPLPSEADLGSFKLQGVSMADLDTHQAHRLRLGR